MRTTSSAGCFLANRTKSWSEITGKAINRRGISRVCSLVQQQIFSKEFFQIVRDKYGYIPSRETIARDSGASVHSVNAFYYGGPSLTMDSFTEAIEKIRLIPNQRPGQQLVASSKPPKNLVSCPRCASTSVYRQYVPVWCCTECHKSFNVKNGKVITTN